MGGVFVLSARYGDVCGVRWIDFMQKECRRELVASD